ncbi:Putative disulfide-bond formation protein [Candidatus Fokinia cryptica]|uniref:Disulfide-bond formation protein n=2 Tax=Candidatus Fokinia crypta TaxID=1920990 RepID=A0ABZ0UP42_9RICK|nr:Putative disulfide-bond formation protein [Candidatus Fokinia cryptica]
MPIVFAICAEKFLHIAPCALCLKVRKIYYFGASVGIFSVILENKIKKWKVLYKLVHFIPVVVAASVVAVSFVHFTIENDIQSFQFLTKYQLFQCSLDAGYEFQSEKEWMEFIQGRHFISCAKKNMILGISFVTLSFAYSILLISYSITRMLVRWYK